MDEPSLKQQVVSALEPAILRLYETARLPTKSEVQETIQAVLERIDAREQEWEARLRYLTNEVSEMRGMIRLLLPESDRYQAFISQTRASFDYQWANLSEGAALLTDDAFLAESKRLLERATGLPASWFAGKRVLDAGCGNGRWSWTMSSCGAQVTAVDQSEAGVAAAREACKEFPEFRGEVRDVLQPLELGSFDLVWCFGVLHHTGDFWKGLDHVTACVDEGGYLFLMFYGSPRYEQLGDFQAQNEYTKLRRALKPLPFDERVRYLESYTKPEHVHGYFDAVSPAINDLLRFDEVAERLHVLGFADIHETFESANPHVMAQRR